MIYFLYGGSWMLGERGYYEFVGRCLAAFGFVVVVADYRLVPEVEYPVFLEDCAAGLPLDAASTSPSMAATPSRIAVMGHSAGAYNAMMIVLAETLLPAMGLADRVRAIVGLSGPYDFYPFDVDVSIRTFAAVGRAEADAAGQSRAARPAADIPRPRQQRHAWSIVETPWRSPRVCAQRAMQ